MKRNPEKVELACLGAVAAGATACAVELVLFSGGWTGAGTSAGAALASGLLMFILTWIVAACGFLIGLLVVGAPVWAILHHKGWVTAGSALAAGAALSAGVAGVWGWDPASFMLVPGAVAGWVLHRIAYGKG